MRDFMSISMRRTSGWLMMAPAGVGLMAQGLSLHSVERVSTRRLICTLRNGDALEPDVQARVVHHREHASPALGFLSHQPTEPPRGLAETQGRRFHPPNVPPVVG